MAAYCPDTDVSSALPTGHGISEGNLTAICVEAKAWVDAGLCVRYWDFYPYTTGSGVQVPAIIRSIARLYGQWVAWTQYLSASSRFMPDTVRELLTEAEAQIEKLVANPPLYNVPSTASSEDLLFGSEASAVWTLEDDEHYFSCSPRDIVPESVRIAGRVYGTDFRVYYKYTVRGWVLQRLTDEIVDDDVVAYSFAYTRRREQDLPPSVDTVRLSRA